MKTEIKKIIKSILLITFIVSAILTPLSFVPEINTDLGLAHAQQNTGSYNRGEDMLPKVEEEPNPKCGLTNMGRCVQAAFENIAGVIGSFLLLFTGWVLGLGGLLLETSLNYTVVGMSETINNLPALNDAWGAFRDLANIFFIFLILYIAISTILQLETSQTKKLLVQLVIVALLLNFSLFFTKVLIDTSNILSIQFHQSISQAGGENGVAGAFMQKLGMQSFADPSGAFNLLTEDSKNKGAINILLVAILSSILFLIVAFVFGAMAIMLIARFIILVFLMILSPLAFIATALPGGGYFQKWFKPLMSQLLFAPAMLAFIWVTLVILGGLFPEGADLGGSIAQLIPTQSTTASMIEAKISIILNFMIIIGMAIFSLIAAKELGVYGANGAIKVGSRWAKRTGRSVAAPARWGATGAKYTGAAAYRSAVRGSGLRKLYEGTQRSKLLNLPVIHQAKEATLGKIVNRKVAGKSAVDAFEEDKRLRNLREDIGNKDQMIKIARELTNNENLTPEAISKIENREERSQRQRERLVEMSKISQAAAKISASNFEGALPEEFINNENIIRNLPDAHFDALMKGSRFNEKQKGKMMEARIGWIKEGLNNPNASEELKSEITEKIKRNTSEREFEHINQNMPEMFEMNSFVEKIPMGMIKKLAENPTFGVGAGEELRRKKYNRLIKVTEDKKRLAQTNDIKEIEKAMAQLFKEKTDEQIAIDREAVKNVMTDHSPEEIADSPDEAWQTEAAMSSMDEATRKKWLKKDIGERRMLVQHALVVEKLQNDFDKQGVKRDLLTPDMKHFLDSMRYNTSQENFASIEAMQKDLGYEQTPPPYTSSYKNSTKNDTGNNTGNKAEPEKPKEINRPDRGAEPFDVEKRTVRVDLKPKPDSDSNN